MDFEIEFASNNKKENEVYTGIILNSYSMNKRNDNILANDLRIVIYKKTFKLLRIRNSDAENILQNIE